MTQPEELHMQKLRNNYLDLVRKCLQIQKTGNIRAFTTIAMEAEHVAQQIQKLARTRRD